MNPASSSGTDTSTVHDPSTVVRQAVRSLNQLDPETAEFLAALSFVLIRVARADGRVCVHERDRMEQILIDHAGISPEHAVLVTEIACHRAQLADCGSSYGISRRLRSTLDRDHRRSVVDLLVAVADADGIFVSVERSEILQIAGELCIDRHEIADRLPAGI
jgi:uncharacterized tellurite resistance protein B-like protein